MIEPNLELNLFECILVDSFGVEPALSYNSLFLNVCNLVPEFNVCAL